MLALSGSIGNRLSTPDEHPAVLWFEAGLALDDLDVKPDGQQVAEIKCVGDRLRQIQIVEFLDLHSRIALPHGPAGREHLIDQLAAVHMKAQMIFAADLHRLGMLGDVYEIPTVGIGGEEHVGFGERIDLDLAEAQRVSVEGRQVRHQGSQRAGGHRDLQMIDAAAPDGCGHSFKLIERRLAVNPPTDILSICTQRASNYSARPSIKSDTVKP